MAQALDAVSRRFCNNRVTHQRAGNIVDPYFAERLGHGSHHAGMGPITRLTQRKEARKAQFPPGVRPPTRGTIQPELAASGMITGWAVTPD